MKKLKNKKDISIKKIEISITIDIEGEILSSVSFSDFGDFDIFRFSSNSKLSLLDRIKEIISYLENNYNSIACGELVIDIFSRNYDFTWNNRGKNYNIVLHMNNFDFIKYEKSLIKIQGIHDHSSDKWIKDYDTKDKDFLNNDELYDDAIKKRLIDSRVRLECGISGNNKVDTLEIINCKVTRATRIWSEGKIKKTIFDNVYLNNGYGYDFLRHDTQYLIIRNFTFIQEYEDENPIDFFPIREEIDSKKMNKFLDEERYDEVESQNFIINNYVLIFENCIFNISIKEEYYKSNGFNFKDTEFNDCIFNESIYLKYCDFKQLMFIKCQFNKQIYLEGSVVNNFIIIESIFNTNTAFKSLRVKDLFLLDSNTFLSSSSFYNSTFSGGVFFYNNIFEKNVDFTYCFFNGYINIATSTFKDIITLQSIKFFKDKEEHYPEILYEIYNYKSYFSDTFKNKKSFQIDILPRDRYFKYYRGVEIPLGEVLNNFKSSMAIFKNNLEKINNYIDANKFYALEMMAYSKYLKYLLLKDTKDKATWHKESKYSYKSIYRIFKKGNLLLDYSLFLINWVVSRNYQSVLWALITWISIPFIASLFYNSSISGNFDFLNISYLPFISLIKFTINNISINYDDFMIVFNKIAFPFYDIGNTLNNSFIINLLKTTEIYVIWQLIRTAMINFKR